MQLIARPYTVADAAAVVLNTAARHTQGTDQKLDDGGDNEVTAADVKDAVDKKHAQGTDTALGTLTANLAMGGFEITGAGPIAGGVNVINVGETTTLSVEQCLGSLCLVTGAYTVVLPAVSTVAEGANVTVYSTGTNVIKVHPGLGDRFILDGVSLDDDHMLDSPGAAGDYVTVIKDSAAGWIVIGRSGVFIDGGGVP